MQQNTQVLASKRLLFGLRISMQCKCCIRFYTTPFDAATKPLARMEYLRASEQLLGFEGCFCAEFTLKILE